MPPPPSIPRETRSQSRKSRVSSDGVESVEAPGSTRKAVTTPRRKPNVRAKPSSNYGAAVDSQAPAQKQAVKLAKREAIGRIEAGVGEAIERSAKLTTNNTKGLTAVAEEEEREAVEDNVSPRDEERAVLINRGDGNEWMDYHHTASDLAGSKNFGSEAHLNGLLNRQKTRAIPQQPAAANQDATSTQPIHSNQSDMSPTPLQSSIHHPALNNSPATTAPVSHGVIPTPWTWKWMWLALIIGLLVSVCSAALSTLHYQQMTTSLSEFQNDCGKKVSSIIPAGLIQRLDELEEQVTHLTENAVMKDDRPFQINWFSYDLGARTNPFLSSPSTRSPKLTIKSRWSLEWKDIKSAWKSSSSPSSQQRQRDDNPPPLLRRRSAGPSSSSSTSTNPNTVLTPYTEFEPRYCAPSGGRGKLQLAVFTPRPITPTELVIEYFHKDKVLSIGSAPKEIELWIEIAGDDDDDNLREEVRRRIKEIYPDIFSRESTQKDRFLDPGMALGKTWVPVGRWIYRISSASSSSSSSSFRDNNNVQYFKIPLDLASIGVVVKQQVLRVNSNWGDVDQTCLVRVGLHGHDPSTPAEYLEDDDGY